MCVCLCEFVCAQFLFAVVFFAFVNKSHIQRITDVLIVKIAISFHFRCDANWPHNSFLVHVCAYQNLTWCGTWIAGLRIWVRGTRQSNYESFGKRKIEISCNQFVYIFINNDFFCRCVSSSFVCMRFLIIVLFNQWMMLSKLMAPILPH